jgi:hypothetical protein
MAPEGCIEVSEEDMTNHYQFSIYRGLKECDFEVDVGYFRKVQIIIHPDHCGDLRCYLPQFNNLEMCTCEVIPMGPHRD